MARGKGKSGLDALFDKVFDDSSVKNAISSLHTDFTPAPNAPPSPAPSAFHDSSAIADVISIIATEPAKEPVNEPVNEPVKEPVNKPDNEPVKPVIAGLPTGAPTGQPANVPANEPDKQPTHEPVKESVHQPVNYPVKVPAHHPANQPANVYDVDITKIDPELWYPFTEKQGRVLLYLLQAGGRSNRNHIADDTGVNIATVKHTLRILAKDGYIGNIQLYADHGRRGFTYSINHAMCADFAARLTGKPVSYPVNQPANQPAHRVANQPANYPANQAAHEPVQSLASFSSRENNLTTTNNDPEFGFWSEEGVTERQLQNWETEFGMNREELLQALKYCRYDLLNNPDRQEVKSAQNWFYKTVKRAGAYPRPEGYKTLHEIRADQERQELADLERQAKELADLRRRKQIAGLELKFQQILAAGEGEEYQELFGQLNSFEKEMGGDILEQALREKFLAQNGVQLHGEG